MSCGRDNIFIALLLYWGNFVYFIISNTLLYLSLLYHGLANNLHFCFYLFCMSNIFFPGMQFFQIVCNACMFSYSCWLVIRTLRPATLILWC